MSFKKTSGVSGFGPHQMTGGWVGFITDETSVETGLAAADVITGEDPAEGETGVTDLHDSDRPNESKISIMQDKVIPLFISIFLSPDFELIHCLQITKTLTPSPSFIKGISNKVLLSMRAFNILKRVHLLASVFISC